MDASSRDRGATELPGNATRFLASNPWFIAAACLVCSGMCGVLLHEAGARPGAARVLPVVLVWAVLVGIAALREPAPGPLAVAATAILVRLPLLATPALLSDDVHRYLWEGLALGEGHNPFLEPPASIDGLDDALRDRVNHPTIPSIYPPLALWWFRLLSVLGGTVATAQIATATVDVAVAVGISEVLRARGRPVWPAWVYALHPVPALEAAHGAHLDVVALLCAVGAVALWDSGRSGAAVYAAVAGVGTKLMPVVMLPALVRSRATAAHLGIAALALLVSAGPVLGAGSELFTAWRTYNAHWAFNGLFHPWIEPVLGAAARPLLVGIGALACGLAAWRTRDPLELWMVGGAAFVLLSPTVHPWYVLWALVPSLLLGRRDWAAAAVFLFGGYAVLLGFDPETGRWQEPWWLWWATWPPALSFLVAGAWTRRQERSDASPTAPYPPANSARNGSDAR